MGAKILTMAMTMIYAWVTGEMMMVQVERWWGGWLQANRSPL